MIHSAEFDNLPEEERYFALTFAHTDSAIALCRALCTHELPRTFASACPMLWLARQATELFYKACLFATLGSVPSPPKRLNMHNMVFFQNEFSTHFPEAALTFDPPVSENWFGGGWTAEQVDQMLRDANTTHQRHRYPTDSRGKDFQDVHMVTPENMLVRLRRSRDQMIVIAEHAQNRREEANKTPEHISEGRERPSENAQR